MQAFNFCWIGAFPAMVFLALCMLPVYIQNGVRNIPEYLALRFGPGVRLLNAWILAGSMLMLAGISLYAMSEYSRLSSAPASSLTQCFPRPS